MLFIERKTGLSGVDIDIESLLESIHLVDVNFDSREVTICNK